MPWASSMSRKRYQALRYLGYHSRVAHSGAVLPRFRELVAAKGLDPDVDYRELSWHRIGGSTIAIQPTPETLRAHVLREQGATPEQVKRGRQHKASFELVLRQLAARRRAA